MFDRYVNQYNYLIIKHIIHRLYLMENLSYDYFSFGAVILSAPDSQSSAADFMSDWIPGGESPTPDYSVDFLSDWI